MQHEDFAELYRFHAPSHLYNGFELLWGLLLLMGLGSWPLGMGTYWRTTWSLWAVMTSWLFAPFWFNPLAFDPVKCREDGQRWLLWMQRQDGSPTSSWEAWYEEEHTYLQTNSWVKRLHVLLPAFRYGLTFVGLLAALSEMPLHEGILLELKVLSRNSHAKPHALTIARAFTITITVTLSRYSACSLALLSAVFYFCCC